MFWRGPARRRAPRGASLVVPAAKLSRQIALDLLREILDLCATQPVIFHRLDLQMSR